MSDGRNSMRTSSPSLAKYLSAAMKRGPGPGVGVTPARIGAESAAHAGRTDSNAKRDNGSGEPGVGPFAACRHDQFSIRAIETGRRLTAAALHYIRRLMITE